MVLDDSDDDTVPGTSPGPVDAIALTLTGRCHQYFILFKADLKHR